MRPTYNRSYTCDFCYRMTHRLPKLKRRETLGFQWQPTSSHLLKRSITFLKHVYASSKHAVDFPIVQLHLCTVVVSVDGILYDRVDLPVKEFFKTTTKPKLRCHRSIIDISCPTWHVQHLHFLFELYVERMPTKTTYSCHITSQFTGPSTPVAKAVCAVGRTFKLVNHGSYLTNQSVVNAEVQHSQWWPHSETLSV